MITSLRLHFPQVRALTVSYIKSRYRKTFAGFLWVVINPLILFGVQSLVFKTFLRIQVPNYSLFLLSGLLPWIFVTGSLDQCTGCFLNAGNLLKSFQLPPLVYLFAQLFDNLINFISAFILILIPELIIHQGFHLSLFLLPLAVILLLGGVTGMTWLLATAQVFFRDTRFILTFVISVTFFLTPVFYPESYVPEQYRWLIHINPVYQLIIPFHALIMSADAKEVFEGFIRSLVVSVGMLALASAVWRKRRNEIIFNL